MVLPSQNKESDPSFVKKTFSTLASNPALSYGDYRWKRNSVVRLQYKQSRRTLLTVLATLPKKYGNVLEVGGGDGAWTRYVAGKSRAVDFLDISPEMLTAATYNLSAYPNITFMEGDLLTSSLEPEKYDLIMLFRCLEYMSIKANAIQKCATALRKNGILIIVTKNPAYLEWEKYSGGKRIHSGQISADDLRALIKEAGCTVTGTYAATLGTQLESSFSRLLWNVIHAILLVTPRVVGESLSRRYAESFLVYARKD
ncbi:MAG: hypothetical protein Athens041674_113 [Parcubacteria group bacterium Athens0416_74]|nr:MAG: hypothetical protein Athens041674_113 [Parcubacteria group bacterium Athens0416_74]